MRAPVKEVVGTGLMAFWQILLEICGRVSWNGAIFLKNKDGGRLERAGEGEEGLGDRKNGRGRHKKKRD